MLRKETSAAPCVCFIDILDPILSPRLHTGNRQRGASLFEALIGILLVAIMGAGLAHVTAKALHTQRYTTTQHLAVIQLREFLQTADSSKDKVVIGEQTLSITPDESTVPLTLCVKDATGTCAANTERTFTSAIPVSRELAIDSTELFGGTVSLTY